MNRRGSHRSTRFQELYAMARHKSIERPPQGRGVRIILAGESHEGTYTVNGPMITVDSVLLGSKRAPLGDATPEMLAKLLLAELVYEFQKRSAA